MHRRIALLCLGLPLLMTACSSSNGNGDPPSSGLISGNWQIALQFGERQNLNPQPQSGFLVQNGNEVTGSVLVSNFNCSGVGAVSGTVSGSDVSLVINPTGSEIDLTGTVGTGQTSMSGNYTILSTGCTGEGDAPQTGTWTANQVTPLNGNFQGTFTSNRLDAFQVTGQVSQGPNTGTTNAALTGNLSLAAGYCFATASVSGVASGTSVVMNLLDSNGNQIGEVQGTSTPDGTSVTGTLSFAGQGSAGTQDCRTNDSGTISLTL